MKKIAASPAVDDAAWTSRRTVIEAILPARHRPGSIEANVGLTPKTLQRVMRLQRFLGHAERHRGLAAAAAEAGYADQSHLTREVRALSGLTPARLLTERAVRTPPE